MAIQIGRRGRLYLKKEASYAVAETLAATNALRHIDLGFTFEGFNRVTSPEKKDSPGPVDRFDRQKTAELSTLVALLRPSGTLNTLPELDPILEAAMGAKTNVTLSTTVSATPAPTTTTATVASAGSLAVGDVIVIDRNSVKYARFLTAVSGTALTWAPALPTAPITGEAVKGGVMYKLTTALAIGLTIAHYLPNFSRELNGAVIDSLALAFNANEEPRATASGPAAHHKTAQAQPGAFTTVGGNPPSGLVGELLIDDTAYLFKSLEATLTNNLRLRNQEYGVSQATEVYRAGRREIGFTLEAFAGENPATLFDKTVSGTTHSLFKQTGRVEGKIVALYAPKVEWKVPAIDDPEEEVNWSFEGMALETADAKNDELRLGFV